MVKQLADITYDTTKEASPFLEKLVPDKSYSASKEEWEIIKKVIDRFTDMKSARSRIDIDWQIWQLIIESKFYPYSDWRTRVNVPLFRALQELFVSEATTRKIDKEINPVWLADVDKAEVLKIVEDYDWNKQKRDKQMTDAEYKCCGFWTVAYFTWFEQKTRIIEDPEVNDSWDIEYTKKIMREGKIILRTLDIRNVYFDDRTTDFEDDNDQIYIEYLTPEQFEAEKDDKNLINTEFVWTTSKQDQAYFTWEDTGKQNQGLIEKMHYWNKQSDKYIIIYNKSILWRNTPIPYAHKELPIVPRQYWYIADSKYGRWLAEACMQFLDKINRLSEMLFDWISRSNNSIFAMWNGLTFDWNKFSFNNQMLKFNWQLNDANFREIKWIAPNQSAFQYLQDLLKEIAIYIGIDISWIVWQASWTAFETAIRTESSLKRVNVVLLNRDYALQEIFERHFSNIMQFFPITKAENIMEIAPDWKIKKWQVSYPKIITEGKKMNDNWKMIEAPWKFEFECKPEYIRWQVDIIVKTNFNAPTLKALKQDSMNKFLTDFSLYSQLSLQNPELTKVLPTDDFIKELAFTHNIDIASIWWFADSISKEKDKLMKVVQQMAWVTPDMWALAWIWWGAPAWQPQPTEPQPQQNMLPNVEAKWWLPPVTTPETPWINNFSPAEKVTM